MDNLPPGRANSTPPSPETDSKKSEPVKQGQFDHSVVTAPDTATERMQQAAEPHTLFRSICSYALTLYGDTQSTLGRLLVNYGGAHSDSMLLSAAQSGQWQKLEQCLPLLSNSKSLIDEAINTAVSHGNFIFIAELCRLTDRSITPEDYIRLLPPWMMEKNSLSDDKTETILRFLPVLPEAFASKLVVEITNSSRVFSFLNRTIEYYDEHKSLKISPVIKKEIERGLDIIQEYCVCSTPHVTYQCSPNRFFKFGDIKIEHEILTFLVKQKNTRLFLHSLSNMSDDSAYLNSFLVSQTSDEELRWIFKTIRYPNFPHCHPTKTGDVFLHNLNRFPKCLDLKLLVLMSSNGFRNESKNKVLELYYEIINESKALGLYDNIIFAIKALKIFNPEQVRDAALFLYNRDINSNDFFKFNLDLLPLDILEMETQKILSNPDDLVNKDQSLRASCYLAAYRAALNRTNPEKAADFDRKVLLRLLKEELYAGLINYQKHYDDEHLYSPFSALNQFEYELNIYLSIIEYENIYYQLIKASKINQGYLAIIFNAIPLIWIPPLLTSYSISPVVRPFEIKLISKLIHCKKPEALLAALESNTINLLTFDSSFNLLTSNFNQTLLNNGESAAIYSNLNYTSNLFRDNTAKGVGNILLYINKLYPRICSYESADIIECPQLFNAGMPSDQLERLLEHQLQTCFTSIICHEMHHYSKLAYCGKKSDLFAKPICTKKDMMHPWMDHLKTFPKEQMDWVFQRCFDSLEKVKSAMPSEIEKTRCDWLLGYFEFLRTELSDDLASLSLKQVLSGPISEWPKPETLPLAERQRMAYMKMWKQSPHGQSPNL